MRELSLNEIKSLELGVLEDVASFCEQNKLRYFLMYGTLLGAIRHNGFIPWDDDIDICMPRSDYRRFIETYKPTRNIHCRLICHENDENYGFTFAKVHDARTVVREKMYLGSTQTPYGVYVDVFPLDGLRNKFQWKIGFLLQKMINVKNSSFGTGRSRFKEILMGCVKWLLRPISTSTLIRWSEKNAVRLDFDHAKRVSFLSDTRSFCVAYSKKDFDLVETHVFEGRLFQIPSRYDDILRRDYGEYMTPPPVAMQTSHHHSTAYWYDVQKKEPSC